MALKKPKLPGVISGLGVTFRTMMEGAVTVQYPHEREDPAPRARGVIALKEENCTACMLCGRSCPDWCIYIEGHKELAPAPSRRRPAAQRQHPRPLRHRLRRSACTAGSASRCARSTRSFWSPEYEYSEPRIAELLHDKHKLGEWMETRPRARAARARRRRQGQEVAWSRRTSSSGSSRSRWCSPRSASCARRTSCTPRSTSWWCMAGAAAQYILLAAEFVAWVQVIIYIGAVIILFLFGIMLTRAPMGGDSDLDNDQRWPAAVVSASSSPACSRRC